MRRTSNEDLKQRGGLRGGQWSSRVYLRSAELGAPDNPQPVLDQLLDQLKLLKSQGQHQLVLNASLVRGGGQYSENLRQKKVVKSAWRMYGRPPDTTG